MFVGKRFCIPLFTAILFLLSIPVCAQQLYAGFSVNGRTISRGDTVTVCLGGSLQFRSVAQGSSNISWRFQRGSFTAATGVGPFQVSYVSTGYDSVVQTISADGEADSTWCIVRVSNSKPQAAYSWGPNGDCGSAPVEFKDLSTGGGLSYSWDFGDGGSSTDASPSYSFVNAIGVSGNTSYTVGLNITDSLGCSASVNHTVTVKNGPDASLSSGDPDVLLNTFNGMATFRKCSNIPAYVFSFANASTTKSINKGYTIQWGDGSADSVFSSWADGVVIQHNFPLGSSTMVVKVAGANGCTGIKTYTIFLGSTPAGGLASLGNTDICASDSLRFAINNISGNPPGTIYSFLINDGSVAQVFNHPPPSTVAHYFSTGSCSFASSSGNSVYNNAFGAYLTIENPCGTTSPSVVPIYVSGKPKAGIYVYPSPVVCTGSEVQIDNISTYGATITPTGGTNSTCINSGKQVWTITPSTGFTVVKGSMGSLNGSSLNGASWTSGETNLHVIFSVPGTYTTKIYIYNNRCGMDSTTYTICVRTPPQASFTMPTRSRCGAGSLQLTNTSPLASCGGDNYSWTVNYLDPLGCNDTRGAAYSFSGSTDSTSYSPALRLNAPGKYIIQLTVASANGPLSCSPAVFTDSFTVIGTPKPEIAVPDAVCISGGYQPSVHVDSCYSPGPFQYQWQYGGGNPSTGTGASPGLVSYPATGDYPVSLVLTDAACNASVNVQSTLKVVPAPVAVAGRDTAVCSGVPFLLGGASVSGVRYRWHPGAGLSDSTIAQPMFVGVYTGSAADTTFSYTLEASLDGSCAAVDVIQIRVKRRPVLRVSPTTAAICVGNVQTLTAAGADQYHWTPGNLTGSQVVVSPGVSTAYTAIGFSEAGCADTASVLVVVRPDAQARFTASNTLICRGSSLAGIISLVKDTVAGSLYTWKDNGIMLASDTAGQFPDWSIAAAGSVDTIRLLVNSPYGCKADSMQLVFQTVSSVNAHFVKDGAAGCGPLTVQFTNDTEKAGNAQFFWDFGNGVGSSLVQPGPIAFSASPYYRDTTYFIRLKAYNGCDTTVWKDSVTVYADPRAALTVSNVLGCSPFTDTLINLSPGSNSSYHWDFGDGTSLTTSSMADLVHVWHSGTIDTFTVVLQATNRCGVHSDSLDLVITPNSIRPAILASANALAGCAPFTAKFNNSSTGAAVITVDFQDGTASTIVPGNQSVITHQYLQAGTYNVRMRLSNACADTTITRIIQVFPAPSAAFSVTPNPVCTGNGVAATNLSANANSYQWIWGDSSTADAGNSTHVFSSAGDYHVQLKASLVNDYGTVCSVISDPQTVSVVDLITAQIDTSAGRACVPYVLNVSARSATGARLVGWSFYDDSRAGGVFQASGPSASYQYNTAGVYKVRLIVENAGGCRDTSWYSFTAYAGPKLNVSGIGTAYTCNTDTTMRLNAGVNYAGVDALSWSWQVNGVLAGSGNPFEYRFQADEAGTVPVANVLSVQVSDAQGCSDSADMGQLIIRPLARPRIQISPDSILYQPNYTFGFVDLSTHYAGQTYRWDPGDRNGWSFQPQMTHTYGDTGVYHVSLQIADATTGCVRYDTTQVRILGVPGYLYVPDAICPGCAVGELRSFLPKGRGLKEYRCRIYNSWGQLVFETTRLDADGAPSEAWNARYNGQSVQQDAYRWQIEARYVNGTEWKGMLYPGKSTPVKSGFVTVVR